MNKRIICFIISLLLLLSAPLIAFAEGEDVSAALIAEASGSKNRVVDSADLLSSDEEASLEAKLEEISERQQFEVVVVTENTLDGKSPMDYADDYYDYYGYGYGADRDGCLLLLAMDTRDWWISTTGYGITALTDYGIQYVGDEFVDGLGSDHSDFYSGFVAYADTVDKLVSDAKSGNVFDTNNNTYNYEQDTKSGISPSSVIISLVIALIIGLIAVGFVKSSYKPVKFNRGAANYLVDGSLVLTQSYDNFLYSNVTSHRIETDSGSGGGGGSSTHTSSSGSSHGGGGGKF